MVFIFIAYIDPLLMEVDSHFCLFWAALYGSLGGREQGASLPSKLEDSTVAHTSQSMRGGSHCAPPRGFKERGQLVLEAY